MKDLVFVAGPCAVESLDQICEIGMAVRESGATHLRYMIDKPRTDPTTFKGVGDEGLKWVEEVRREVELPLVTEVLDPRDVGGLVPYVDVFQVGSRSSQNFALLGEVGEVAKAEGKKVILKRGMHNTLAEWEGAFGYLDMEQKDVWMCERGIRSATSAGHSRNVLDLGVIPVLKARGYNVLVDPSHGTGRRGLIERMSAAAVMAGADGLEIEVHNDPPRSVSDAAQAITPNEFKGVFRRCQRFRQVFCDTYGTK